MTTKREALEIFNTMYTERTMRDHYYDIRALCTNESESKQLTEMACKHNAASNEAMMTLDNAGYCAFRDESNNSIPTLCMGDQVIAYWDEYKGVEPVAPVVDPCVEAMAKAVREVPGFSRMLWKAATSLYATRNQNKEVSNYEATHKKGGKALNEMRLFAARADGRYSAMTDAIEAVLSSVDAEIDWYDRYDAISDEINEIMSCADWKTCYLHADRY